MSEPEIPAVPAPVPGSVQQALRNAGVLPDWNVAEVARQCEWVENRQWIYETRLPDDWLGEQASYRLHCLGLDYSGWVLVNDTEIGPFAGTYVPHTFDLTPYLAESGNRLRIVFDLPPRWLGQFGYTSKMREWKVRFNYTWDWQPRLVQIGIWDAITLEVSAGAELTDLRCDADADLTDGTGVLRISGTVVEAGAATVEATLLDGDQMIRSKELTARAFNEDGVDWKGLPIELWWPNGQGDQPLYTVRVSVRDTDGVEHDRAERRIGFRHITWQQCDGAPEGADPWICVVNGRPIFLQGVNFPPLMPNFADASVDLYRQRLTLYRDLGVNTFRINGVGFLEKECFYDICDEYGLLVWQDVPLSSSGVENVPPDDEASIEHVTTIFRSFIQRRHHHASLFIWCGGNELFYEIGGQHVPVTSEHPLIARLSDIARELDPARRFVAASPTGPRGSVARDDIGLGLHWDTHGPYWVDKEGMPAWSKYWQEQDSLFLSELGNPAASPTDIIERYAGDLNPLPVSASNPVWRRPFTWWIEPDAFADEHGRPPETLDEYVQWSQNRQAEALTIAVSTCKKSFPKTGGVLHWCGHDSYPCAANSSLIDFHGNPKPAALALKAVWTSAER